MEEALTRGFSAREALARLDEARLIRRTALSQFDLRGDVQAIATRQRTYDLGSGSGIGFPAPAGAGPIRARAEAFRAAPAASSFRAAATPIR